MSITRDFAETYKGDFPAGVTRTAGAKAGQDYRNATIQVYIDDGTKYAYVCRADQAREHSHAIITTGYSSVKDGVLTHIPPHRILKVKAAEHQMTEYEDTVSGT